MLASETLQVEKDQKGGRRLGEIGQSAPLRPVDPALSSRTSICQIDRYASPRGNVINVGNANNLRFQCGQSFGVLGLVDLLRVRSSPFLQEAESTKPL